MLLAIKRTATRKTAPNPNKRHCRRPVLFPNEVITCGRMQLTRKNVTMRSSQTMNEFDQNTPQYTTKRMDSKERVGILGVRMFVGIASGIGAPNDTMKIASSAGLMGRCTLDETAQAVAEAKIAKEDAPTKPRARGSIIVTSHVFDGALRDRKSVV